MFLINPQHLNRKRYIPVLLLLSFSIVLVHSMVPHHHHAEVIVAAGNDSCPTDNDEHHKESKRPFHCHAFNALSFFKATPTVISNSQQSNSPSSIYFDNNQLSAHIFFEFECHILLTESSTSIFEGGNRLLRGPPMA